jgi:hypothetical protein
MDRLHEQIRGSGYALVLTDATGAVLYEKSDPSLPNVTLERMGPGVPVRGAGQEVIAVLDAACLPSAGDARQPPAHDGAHQQTVRAPHRKVLVFASPPAACGAALPRSRRSLWICCTMARSHSRPMAPSSAPTAPRRNSWVPTIATSSWADRCATYLTPRERTSSRLLYCAVQRCGRCVNCAADSVSMRASTADPRRTPRRCRCEPALNTAHGRAGGLEPAHACAHTRGACGG